MSTDMEILTELRRLTDDLPRLKARVKSSTAALKEAQDAEPMASLKETAKQAKYDLESAKERIAELMKPE